MISDQPICEAVTRPSMRFVPDKEVNQQAVLMMHWARNLLVCQRTMAVNTLRAHLAEFGVDCSHGQRSKPVSVWARIRGLARHDTAPEFLRRQGAAGANQQTW
jgi:transposase